MKIDIDQLVAGFGKAGLKVQRFSSGQVGNEGTLNTLGIIDLSKIVDAINAILEPELDEEDAALVATAREKYCNDDREIDDSPMLSRGEEGAFVSAWLYIPYPKKEENDVHTND